MREWDEEISRWLARSEHEPVREPKIIAEMTRRLDKRYEALLSQGATEESAYSAALAELTVLHPAA